MFSAVYFILFFIICYIIYLLAEGAAQALIIFVISLNNLLKKLINCNLFNTLIAYAINIKILKIKHTR